MRNLKKEFEATFKDGEPLYDTIEDYWIGVAGEGDLGYVWKDKPHRLVFQLIAAVVYERKQVDMMRERAEKAEAMLYEIAHERVLHPMNVAPARCPACGGDWQDDKNGACDNEFHCYQNRPAPAQEQGASKDSFKTALLRVLGDNYFDEVDEILNQPEVRALLARNPIEKQPGTRDLKQE